MSATPWDAALFDMDGLLIDSEALALEAFRATTDELALGDQHAVFVSLIGTNNVASQDILTRAFGERTDVARFTEQWQQRYRDAVQREPVPLKPGVHEMLDWLGSQGVKRAVATSTSRALAEDKLERSGIRGYFLSVTGGDDIQRSKPAPDIYLAAGRTIDADMRRTLGFEDSPNGVKSALAAGLSVFQIPDLVDPSPELLALGHRVCSDLHEARRLLASAVDGGSLR